MNKFLIRYTLDISTFSIRFGYAQKENFSVCFFHTSAYVGDILRLGMSVTTQSGSGRQYVGSGRQYVTGS